MDVCFEAASVAARTVARSRILRTDGRGREKAAKEGDEATEVAEAERRRGEGVL